MIAPFGCLRGIQQAGSMRVIEVVESRLREVLQSVLWNVEFDEKYYRAANPDVDAKIRSGEIGSAKMHYVLSGYYEDRFPRKIIVDEAWYLAEYPDVAEAVARRYFTSASHHFGADGFREGRLAHAGWSLMGGSQSASKTRQQSLTEATL